MKRVLGYLRAPDKLGAKIYAEASQIEGVDYIDTSLTCDPTDTFCHRGLPKFNATLEIINYLPTLVVQNII
jgi:hypothetical protein